MKYTEYNVEDFVLDESFRNWVLMDNAGNEAKWRAWIYRYPQMKPVVEEAQYIIYRLHGEEVQVSQEEIDHQFEEVADYFNKTTQKSGNKFLSFESLAKIAAVVLMLITLGAGLFYHSWKDQQTQVAENNQKEATTFPSQENNAVVSESQSTASPNTTAEKTLQESAQATSPDNSTQQQTTLAGASSSQPNETSKTDQKKPQTLTYAASKGEQQKITLPDGSKVYLNENSQLAFAEDWENGTERKVELKGEAYFQVEEQVYQGRKIKFVVIAQDVRVEVVGTEFTVKELIQSTQVFLQSGKIMLDLPKLGKRVEMDPNEMVEYNKTSGRMKLSEGVDKSSFISWVNNFDQVVREAEEYMKGSKQGSSQSTGQGNNTSRVLQSGDENSAYIQQIGENNKSVQVQSGMANQAQSNISGARDDNDELSWSTGQIQHGEGNVSIFNIVDSYNSNMFSGQAGKSNTVRATSKGEENMGLTIQFGQGNKAHIYQEGRENDVIILQKGEGNIVGPALEEGVYQQGQYNEVDILQKGINNQAKTMQRGSRNKTNINQNGN
jgi:ferric-dicitrate binding protein FerR (iron transport regulator)